MGRQSDSQDGGWESRDSCFWERKGRGSGGRKLELVGAKGQGRAPLGSTSKRESLRGGWWKVGGSAVVAARFVAFPETDIGNEREETHSWSGRLKARTGSETPTPWSEERVAAMPFESQRNVRLCRRGAERQREQRIDSFSATSAPLPLCGKPNILRLGHSGNEFCELLYLQGSGCPSDRASGGGGVGERGWPPTMLRL
jgi:hypothetical protein